MYNQLTHKIYSHLSLYWYRTEFVYCINNCIYLINVQGTELDHSIRQTPWRSLEFSRGSWGHKSKHFHTKVVGKSLILEIEGFTWVRVSMYKFSGTAHWYKKHTVFKYYCWKHLLLVGTFGSKAWHRSCVCYEDLEKRRHVRKRTGEVLSVNQTHCPRA